MRALLLLLATATAAHADDAKTTLAAGMRIEASAIVEAQDFRIEAGDYYRVVAGRWKHQEKTAGGVALVWCDKKDKCWIAREWFGWADSVEVLGLIDLRAPSAFPTRAQGKYDGAMKLPKAKWPALVVRFTTRERTASTSRHHRKPVDGTHERSEISVLSLAPEDHANPEVFRKLQDESWPTGLGVTVTFSVGKKTEIVASEQRHLENGSMCIEPPPTLTTYVFEKEHRRYVERTSLEKPGCR
jgi:hypothetical protein